MSTYKEALEKLRKSDDFVVAMYMYGSYVYGTAMEESDHDMITVLKRINNRHEILDRDEYSFVLHEPMTLQRGIWAHEPYALECFFLPEDKILKAPKKQWDFKLDKRVLRESFSQKASHSFVKAKKKFEVENDVKRAKKSLFHSLRIITFGIQLATKGEIYDYSEANEYWWDIWTMPSTSWDDYAKIYRPIYNGLSTKFREVCPK